MAGWRNSEGISAGARDDGLLTLVGAATGCFLAVMGTSPTGATITDIIVLLLSGIAVVWCGAWAPWWMIAAMAGLGATIADGWVPLALGAAVVCVAAVLGGRGEERRWIWGSLVGASVVVLASARELGDWGGNAVVAIAAAVVVSVAGVIGRPGQRRRALVVTGVVGVLAGLAVGGLAAAANTARGDLSDGSRIARDGLSSLESGEFDAARSSFAEAATAFGNAGDALGSPFAQPSRLVPVASQHRAAASQISAAAQHATATLGDELDAMDLDSFGIVDGRIDVDAVRDLIAPMTEVQAAIDELDVALEDADSGWLIEPVQRRIDELAVELDEQRELGDQVLAAIEVAPDMLGADGERVYFVMFTTPAEARGQGGFMGNWAEIAIDDGRITMTDLGNDDVLNEQGPRPRRLENAPLGWVSRYGQFGFTNGPDSTVNVQPWKNITMSPDFPATSQVVAELYPKSGGREIDGVINLDVYALEELIGLVGPIEVDEAPDPLTGENTADYLLFEQYLQFPGGGQAAQAPRGDMLEEVTRQTFDRLLYENPPDPLEFGRTMAPLVEQRRVFAWSAHDDEAAVIASAELDGAMRRDEDDLASVSFNNTGGSKIDVFLRQSFEVVDGADGPEIHFHLENTAPAEGLPPYIIDNLIGMPLGYSKLWVTGYASVPVVSVTDDGEALDDESSFEAGLHTLSAMVVLEPGESTTIVFGLDAPDKDASEFSVLQQPAVRQPPDLGD